jgi:hypothetical protein
VVPFIENRATQSKTTPRQIGDASLLRDGPRIGGEIEAWCGPCGGLTTHHIVAMVGNEPKQVICQACQRRHGFRLTPARGAAKMQAAASSEPAQKRKKSREEMEHERRQAERKALREELLAAAEVRPFDPKARYKPGEIIEHPEHGRGKVENVLRKSLLVRFEEGLRPLDLV